MRNHCRNVHPEVDKQSVAVYELSLQSDRTKATTLSLAERIVKDADSETAVIRSNEDKACSFRGFLFPKVEGLATYDGFYCFKCYLSGLGGRHEADHRKASDVEIKKATAQHLCGCKNMK